MKEEPHTVKTLEQQDHCNRSSVRRWRQRYNQNVLIISKLGKRPNVTRLIVATNSDHRQTDIVLVEVDDEQLNEWYCLFTRML